MQVTVRMEFKAERREPLGELIRRVAAQFERAGSQPVVVASFTDNAGATSSAVDRALKKYPHLAAFERNDAPSPRIPPFRRLTNLDAPHALAMQDVLALADGVPRSLPFHNVTVQFRHADFGAGIASDLSTGPVPGITVQDIWWVNGRTRTLYALYAVDADAASKTLPSPPPSIAAILAGLGKPRRSRQFVRTSDGAKSPAEAHTPAAHDHGAAIAPILAKYRSNLQSMVGTLGLPHDLPPEDEARRLNAGASGPLKPTLVEIFRARGFDCVGGSGIFTLQRRTAGNHVVELYLDVGTWSRSVSALFRVRGPGFNATLELPVTLRARGRQYPIGDVHNWRRIVENLAVIVDALDRTFVSEVEAAAGPAPQWFSPGRD